MTTSTECAIFCEENNINLDYCDLPINKSMSFEEDDEQYIVMDKSEMTEIERKCRLVHEIGHCMTGAFYNRRSPLEIRSRCEHKANVYEAKKLLPKEEMLKAFKKGYVEARQLAEYF